ncbi:Rapid ALkalinization Factor [Heracleum sosnowskyi]|uniref:Rapid ALkalinization Factor n=1 Tax=Heracleum sosnowskyi TaxID=360622 RepID=A0AAD8ISK2_9APIA|nr:Rapid ALkalinization Factor [Heracleum sosnowskyi]
MARFSIPVFVLLLAMTMAIIVESSHSPFDVQLGLIGRNGDGGLLVGDMIDPNEEMMMESESARRNLVGKRYISYDALRKNSVPCSRRGQSYYNCQQSGRANPYRRGCTVATRCARR